MARSCTLCKHEYRSAIDVAIAKKESIRTISKRFSVSSAAVFRHKAHVGVAAERVRVIDEFVAEAEAIQAIAPGPRYPGTRYAAITDARIAKYYERYMADPQLADLRPDVAFLRALVRDLIDRYDAETERFRVLFPKVRDIVKTMFDGDKLPKERRDATNRLRLLFEELENSGLAGDTIDVSRLRHLILDTGKMVERMVSQQSAVQFSVDAVTQLQKEMAEVLIREAARDFPTKEQAERFCGRIAQLWDELHLPMAS